jgi:hypothetical protein
MTNDMRERAREFAPSADESFALGTQCRHIHAYENSSSYLNCMKGTGHVGPHRDGHGREWRSGDDGEVRAMQLWYQFRADDMRRELKARAADKE